MTYIRSFIYFVHVTAKVVFKKVILSTSDHNRPVHSWPMRVIMLEVFTDRGNVENELIKK